MTDFYLFHMCTDTRVIVTHAFIFLPASGPIVLLTHAQLTIVTQSCAVLHTVTYCSCDVYCSRYVASDLTSLLSYSNNLGAQ